MARRRRAPIDPAAIINRRRIKAQAEHNARLRAQGIDPAIAAWGDEEVSPQREAELVAQGVEVVLDQRRRLKRARKIDVWEELHGRGRLSDEQYSAVRDLMALMAKRARVTGAGGAAERVDAQGACAEITDAALDAGRRVDLTLYLIGPPLSKILTALLMPAVLCVPYDWRAIVAREVGETRPEAQAVPLRMAAQALVDVADDVPRILASGALAVDRVMRAREDAVEALCA